MSELIKRLREAAKLSHSYSSDLSVKEDMLDWKAADRIQQLEAALEDLYEEIRLLNSLEDSYDPPEVVMAEISLKLNNLREQHDSLHREGGL